MSKQFKIGDRVRVMSDAHSMGLPADIIGENGVVVASFDGLWMRGCRIKIDREERAWYVHPDDLEPIDARGLTESERKASAYDAIAEAFDHLPAEHTHADAMSFVARVADFIAYARKAGS